MEQILRDLDDDTLLKNTKICVEQEKNLTLQVLKFLQEVERRRLFARRAYPHLFAFCVEELGYSPAAAQRRISAMRLLRDVPEVEEKIESGSITLDTASKVHNFFRREEITASENKREVIQILEGKSSRDVERELSNRSTEVLPKEHIKIRPGGMTELRILMDESSMAELERLRNRFSQLSLGKLFKMALGHALRATDPARERKKTSKSAKATANDAKAPAQNALNAFKTSGPKRHIPAHLRREVFQRDGERCTFVDERTGKRCEECKNLELDHIQSFALGGRAEASNLRILCRAHNILHAVDELGPERMQNFIRT